MAEAAPTFGDGGLSLGKKQRSHSSQSRMMTLLTFIFAQLSLPAPEFDGMNYTQRQEIAESTTFRHCTFRDCSVEGSGGAIGVFTFLVNPIRLEIAGCLFANCSSTEFGGAVDASVMETFLMNQTCCVQCSASVTAACLAIILSVVDGRLEVHDSSATLCNAIERETLCLASEIDSGGPPTLVNGLNLSANWVRDRASGLETNTHFDFSFHFSIFCSNSRGSCLSFGRDILNSDISCLALRNNTVEPDAERPGLLSVYSTIILRSCGSDF
jgi:hypothetical protein